MAVTPVVKGADFSATVPGFWVMGALLAWAVRWHWHRAGWWPASCSAATDLLVRHEVTQSNYGNVFLLAVGGPIVGYMCASLQQMSRERDRAERAAAAAAERARLARAVHDGVLQVLALVQRRGAELGGDGAELARLAGEQEAALRALIREQDAVAAPVDRPPAGLDLAAALAAARRAGPASASRRPARRSCLAAPVAERAGRRGGRLPRQRRGATSATDARGLGAARGLARPGRGLRARRGPRHRRPGRLEQAEAEGGWA